VEIIVLTAHGTIADGVQAIKNGAFDYIVKGDDNNKIIPLLYRAVEKIELVNKVNQLEAKIRDQYSFDSIIGESEAIRKAVSLAKKVAPGDTSILLTGETGTGKEVFAQSIHHASLRRHKSFVAVNCAAFGRELLESEMFGHKAGAFTGATKDKRGLLEEAHQGTIFLDEIGEMSLDLQSKLLRVIETGEFLRVGETKPTKVDIRIIAATHRDLSKEITEGHFREDLYYRISVFQIHLPALRERLSDMELLVTHFIRLFRPGKEAKGIELDPTFYKALKMHSWKGNIRELRNVIERSLILMEGKRLYATDLPVEFQQTEDVIPGKSKEFSAFSMAAAEKLHIQKVLNYTQGNKSETARLLGIGITTLYRKIEEYRIS
jgi:DNA-binding NtrC family response regulator